MTQKPKIRPLPMLNICTQKWRDMSGTHLTRHCDQGDMVFLEHSQPLGHSQPKHSPRGHLSAWALSIGLSLSLLEGTSSADAGPSGKLPPLSAALSAKYPSLQRPPKIKPWLPPLHIIHRAPKIGTLPPPLSMAIYQDVRDEIEIADGISVTVALERIASEDYPPIPEALALSLAGQEGKVQVQITLDNETGDIKTLTIVHSDLPSLNNLLLEHLKSWKFNAHRRVNDDIKIIQPFYFTFNIKKAPEEPLHPEPKP